ncbi:penicillin-binding protein [Plantactinospora endophytica]|uniref:Penicillin-binding protein n=1 Tax=Plantactinospora endophytica TaxID=673535 RepID=A0ABQ4DZE2_9ACTN|nr:penicillin-binding protein [Plantactinospora endophytica]
MNSYGDPSSARGRAQYPGANGDSGPADDPYQRPSWDDPGAARRSSDGDRGGWPANQGRAGGASARASVSGGASPGRATPPGRASVDGGLVASVSPTSGSASAGRARVGGSASVSAAPALAGRYGAGGASAGRASVGSASVAGGGAGGDSGRAGVGRAAVPVSSAGPSGVDEPNRPGRSGARRGRRGELDEAAQKRAKKRKRMNVVIAMFAVFVMLAGGGVVGITYYSTNIVMPNQIPLPVGTTILDSRGKTIVTLGQQARTIVPLSKVPQHVQWAVAAAEDRSFYDHDGVDYVGIARAAWNNFTGGTKQGASTITQQYARNAYQNLADDSYQRKLKEAIFASRLNDEFSKEEIMQHYLNTIYFGRGAYGIEMAALTFFGKSAEKLDVGEGAVLAGMIKQPVNDPQTGVKGYDPAQNPEAAEDRWNYVLNGMVEKKWLDPAKRPATYPTVAKPRDASASVGVKTPKGNVVNYVRAEMDAMGLCHDGAVPAGSAKPNCQTTLATDGYKITTSIDRRLQDAAEAAAQQEKKSSPLSDQPENLQAALVSIDPKTGRVLAYYGGNSGVGIDYAGKNIIGGKLVGGHPPGSSFKVYTLAAAIEAKISIESHWDSTPFKPEGFKDQVVNAGRNPDCKKYCELAHSTVQSYNVPFYHVSAKIGPDNIVGMARQAGVTTMWTTGGKGPEPVDLTKKKPEEVAPSPFFHVVAYGQYPITVLDHANGLATLANRGKYNKAHFIVKIEQQDKQTGVWKKIGGEQIKPAQRIQADVADEVTSVLKKIPGANNHSLAGGRAAAGKTGTWQYGDTKQNADAWMVGYTPEIATAVWIGSDNPKKPKILKAGGGDVSGGGLPADIWKQYMDKALDGVKKSTLPDSKGLGNREAGNGEKPAAPPPNCANPVDGVCPPTNPGDPDPGDPNPGDPDGPGGPVIADPDRPGDNTAD